MKYKCPICGCEEHFEVKNFEGNLDSDYQGLVKIITAYGSEDGFDRTYSNFKSFVCKKCGHVDLFMDIENVKQAIFKELESKKTIEDKIHELEFKKENVFPDFEKNKKRLVELEKLLKSESIPVGEYRKLEAEYKNLEREFEIHPVPSTAKFDNEIHKLKESLSAVKNSGVIETK